MSAASAWLRGARALKAEVEAQAQAEAEVEAEAALPSATPAAMPALASLQTAAQTGAQLSARAGLHTPSRPAPVLAAALPLKSLAALSGVSAAARARARQADGAAGGAAPASTRHEAPQLRPSTAGSEILEGMRAQLHRITDREPAEAPLAQGFDGGGGVRLFPPHLDDSIAFLATLSSHRESDK